MMTLMPSARFSYTSALDTVLTLPGQTGSLAIAEACRATALAFLDESHRWGKAELAMWLMGPYAQLTQYIVPSSRRGNRERGRSIPLLREIDARLVERMIRSANDEVVATLRRIHDDESSSFAYSMMASGFVARCEDRDFVAGFVPTAAPRRLADRVLSLLAADYLTRPGDYAVDPGACTRCDPVEVDSIARIRGGCLRHGSGFFALRTGGSILPYLPEGA